MTEPEIVLYDLACAKNVPFSPVVWRIRLMLNYKGVPYKSVFLEFPNIEPTLKGLGVVPPESAKGRYTVPTIYHVPTGTYLMDSTLISQFLESTYPHPPLPLTSDLGREIETKARSVLGPAARTSLMPREVHILSPRTQEWFRRSREAQLGHSLKNVLEKEDQMWASVQDGLSEVNELILTNREKGRFVLGAKPSYTDFVLVGALESARVIDEGVWRRLVEYEGFREVYKGCKAWMKKID